MKTGAGLKLFVDANQIRLVKDKADMIIRERLGEAVHLTLSTAKPKARYAVIPQRYKKPDSFPGFFLQGWLTPSSQRCLDSQSRSQPRTRANNSVNHHAVSIENRPPDYPFGRSEKSGA
jgi:hypothetical protein